MITNLSLSIVSGLLFKVSASEYVRSLAKTTLHKIGEEEDGKQL